MKEKAFEPQDAHFLSPIISEIASLFAKGYLRYVEGKKTTGLDNGEFLERVSAPHAQTHVSEDSEN